MPADGKHWKRLLEALPKLKAIGIDNIWLPPGCKASSPNGNGYDIYDLYDLGEFNQKGSRATKWGTKEELMELAKLAKESGVGLYWDAVLNHKAAADNKEKCKVVEVDLNGTLVDVHSTSPLWFLIWICELTQNILDRTKEISEPYEIKGWLGFDFPGRGDKYSSQKYHWYHFSGSVLSFTAKLILF